jgi:hypothetical protein
MTRLVIAGMLAALATVAAPAQAATITEAQAGLMCVPSDQLGHDAQGLLIELPSGPTDNARAADDSFDPADNEATVKKAGRLFGFTLLYDDPSLKQLETHKGLVDIGSSVDVFRSATQAAAYSQKAVSDLTRLRGRNLAGVTIAASGGFPVPKLGDESRGVKVIALIGDTPLFGTYVDFRIGNVLAEAVVTRADQTVVDAQVIAIARTLEQRMRDVLAGRLKGAAPTVPRPLGPPGKPPNGPDLAGMALRVSDTPRGSTVSSERYVSNENALATYSREFQTNPQTSGLLSIKNDISLARSPEEARGRMRVLRQLFTARNAAFTVTDAFTGSAGKQATKMTFDGVATPKVGDEAFSVAVSFTYRNTRFRVVLVYVRTGRAVGTIVLTGAATPTIFNEAAGLGQALAKRMKAAKPAPPLVA